MKPLEADEAARASRASRADDGSLGEAGSITEFDPADARASGDDESLGAARAPSLDEAGAAGLSPGESRATTPGEGFSMALPGEEGYLDGVEGDGADLDDADLDVEEFDADGKSLGSRRSRMSAGSLGRRRSLGSVDAGEVLDEDQAAGDEATTDGRSRQSGDAISVPGQALLDDASRDSGVPLVSPDGGAFFDDGSLDSGAGGAAGDRSRAASRASLGSMGGGSLGGDESVDGLPVDAASLADKSLGSADKAGWASPDGRDRALSADGRPQAVAFEEEASPLTTGGEGDFQSMVDSQEDSQLKQTFLLSLIHI